MGETVHLPRMRMAMKMKMKKMMMMRMRMRRRRVQIMVPEVGDLETTHICRISTTFRCNHVLSNQPSTHL
jgi:hypothetical protein